MLVALLCTSASAKDFALISGGGVMSCKQAVAFRDGPLLAQYDALAARYDSGREARLKAVQQEFATHRAALATEWKRASASQRRALWANGITLAMSAVSAGTGKWLKGQKNLSAVDKIAAEILIERGTSTSSVVVKAGLTETIDPKEVLAIPVMTIAAAAGATIVGVIITTYAVTQGTIDTYFAWEQLKITDHDFAVQDAVFVKALDDVLARSSDAQIRRVNAMKNAIDAVCG
jgi:hypothetical protein